jgi:asparagine synthase (glutamine-hydrolysing)
VSAVFGIIRFDGSPVTDDALKRMGAALQARGPDGIRHIRLGNVGLGHCLLRVNREDRFERQPVTSGSLTLVADARIDNRDEIARALAISPEDLARMSDSDVILAAYRAWGAECADRLLGDFVFAVWDAERQTLVIARDPIGMRGIHWYRGDGFAAFATEAKGLMALHEVPRDLDPTRLMRSVVRDFRSSANSGLVPGIGTIRGGTVRSITADGEMTDTCYWRPHAAAEHEGRDASYYHETYRRLVGEAIACRVRRLIDPPGLLLSGGFDSAIIAGLARAPAAELGHRVVSVTSAMAPDGGTVETRAFDAREGAQWCHDHMPDLDHEWWVRSDESPLDRGGMADHVSDDVPLQLGFVFDGMYASLRRRGARTAFDGIGGDETINPRTPARLDALWASRSFAKLWREARGEAAGSRVGALRLMLGAMMPQWFRRWRRGAPEPDGIYWTRHYCRPGQLDQLVAEGAVEMPERTLVRDRAARLRTLDLLQSRARQNNANEAAARGLELVRPMLDRRLIEFGLAIPDDVQRVGGRSRMLARSAFAKVLPPEFSTRENSQEWLLPQSLDVLREAAETMRGDFERWRDKAELHDAIDIDRLLSDLAPDRLEKADPVQLATIARLYLTARHIAWLRGFN